MKRYTLVALLARKRAAWPLLKVAQPGVSLTGVFFGDRRPIRDRLRRLPDQAVQSLRTISNSAQVSIEGLMKPSEVRA